MHKTFRVNAIRSGRIDTETQLSTGVPVRVSRLLCTIPMVTLGAAAKVAEAAGWRLSDNASYVSASVLPVSGGR